VTIKHLTRLPKVGAALLWAAVQRFDADLHTVAGAAFVVAGAWYFSEGAGKMALGAFLILGGLIRSAKTR
jgi:hypothetical protein